MRKSRVRTSASKTLRIPVGDCLRFAGVALSGGKADKAAVAILDSYPKQKKLFLSKLIEPIRSEEFVSADLKICEVLLQHESNLESVVFDAPLTLPKCVTCQLKCPGFEACQEPEIQYMRKQHVSAERSRKRRMFTPYTQRAVESWLASRTHLEVQHALGANAAPLAARALFLRRRLPMPSFEIMARLAVWQLGQQFKVRPSQLRTYRNSVGGEDARRSFLQHMQEYTGIFVYQMDLLPLVEHLHAFEALIASYMGWLHQQELTQAPPPGFPKGEGWVLLTQQTLDGE